MIATVRGGLQRLRAGFDISGFSAHADASELDRWLATAPAPPTRTFCVHGELPALEAVRRRLADRGWDAVVPKHLERFDL